ncbi:hypothetical protein B0H13DRAFT_2688352 [Mycena leptocephala]|nr:hypothetical protein B0H13DRAFT_2688352 [Mycena leptocephala]
MASAIGDTLRFHALSASRPPPPLRKSGARIRFETLGDGSQSRPLASAQKEMCRASRVPDTTRASAILSTLPPPPHSAQKSCRLRTTMVPTFHAEIHPQPTDIRQYFRAAVRSRQCLLCDSLQSSRAVGSLFKASPSSIKTLQAARIVRDSVHGAYLYSNDRKYTFDEEGKYQGPSCDLEGNATTTTSCVTVLRSDMCAPGLFKRCTHIGASPPSSGMSSRARRLRASEQKRRTVTGRGSARALTAGLNCDRGALQLFADHPDQRPRYVPSRLSLQPWP